MRLSLEKRSLVDRSDTDQTPQKRANTESSTISSNRIRQPTEENPHSQLDKLSFELTVTAPNSKNPLAFFNDMNFRGSRSIRSVFKDDRSPSAVLMASPEYLKFKADFQLAYSNMGKNGELWIRVKLNKPSDSTKNQDIEPSPSETQLRDEAKSKLFQLLQSLVTKKR